MAAALLLACAAPKQGTMAPQAPPAAMDAGGGDKAEEEQGSEADAALEAGEAEGPNRDYQQVEDASPIKQDRSDTTTDPEAQLAQYEQMLQQREQQLRGAGIALAHLGDEVAPNKDKNNAKVEGGISTKSSTKRSTKKKSKPESRPSSKPVAGGSINTCSNICMLKQSTCDLEQKICDLASRNSDSERYANVCQRAQQDCKVATTACTKCGG